MCGLLGSVNNDFDYDVLNLIKHRGPDSHDILKKTIAQQRICMGHVRLAIQDLSAAGHQPMTSHCGKFIIIFNGEIYNHQTLRGKLTDHKFLGHSDTETIVNYLAKYGMESIQDLNGIFSLAIIDIETERLYLSRDRYGVKPLYYSIKNNSIIFSSEITPIQTFTESTINKSHLASLLKLRYNPAPDTLYDNISKLKTGHTLRYDLNKHTHTTSSFITPVKTNENINFDTALVRYGELFEQAVKRQLLADVEVGVLLSGGIDSALVAYYAQKHSCKPVKTFTIGFTESHDSDETIDARETAKILGTEHFEVKISYDQFEEMFKECIDIVEEPLGTTSIIPMYFLNKLASQHVKVVLTGQGADEPLCGYNKYKGEILAHKYPRFIFNILKPTLPLVKNDLIHRAINSLGEKNNCKRFELIYELFSDADIKALINTSDDRSLPAIQYFYSLLQGQKKDSPSAMMANDLRMSLSDDLLLYTDKISMHFSLEARVPILDNDLIDFIESLPLEMKYKDKQLKYIHKKFAESVLPKTIIYRNKKAFKSPTDTWFKGTSGLNYKAKLTEEHTPFSEFFDLSAVAYIFDLHLTEKRNMERQLFTLISIYYWMDKHNISKC